MSDPTFISRWSRRKIDARKGVVEEDAPKAEAPPAAPVVAAEPAAPPALPPVESLTPESDFTPFMGKGVDAGVKRQALKTLFQDPRFNVMDGLDVYIDDYSKPDPLPEGWLEKMNQVARLGEYRAPVEAAEAPDGQDPSTADARGDAPAVSDAAESAEPAAAIPVDTDAPESPPPPVPESGGEPPRNSGHMV